MTILKMAKIGVFIIVLASKIIIDCASLALSVVTVLKYAQDFDETSIAMLCNAVAVISSVFVLLCITLPAGCISCCRDDEGAEDSSCCTPTCYVSVIVAGSISIIGTFAAGILLVFNVSIHEEENKVASFIRVAASLNFIATAFGAITIAYSLCLYWCMRDDEDEDEDRDELCCVCSKLSVVALLLIAILLISCLAATFLTGSMLLPILRMLVQQAAAKLSTLHSSVVAPLAVFFLAFA